MADFFTDMANMARDVLKPSNQGGLGARTGSINLMVQQAPTPPTNPWDPPAVPVYISTPVRGQVFGVGQDLIGAPVPNGGQIVASDEQAILALWGGTAKVTDILQVDGKKYTILAVSQIPEAGTKSAVRLIIRA